MKLEPQARGGVVTVRLDPVRVVEIGRSGFFSRMTGAVIEEAPAITALTQGGVVFKRFEGVVLDAGWGRGEVAFRKFPDAESTFTDRGGRTCSAPNREVFSYEDRLHPVLAHGSDAELARFLTARCGEEFDVAPLRAGPSARRHLRARAAEHGPASAPPAAAPALAQARAGRSARPGSAGGPLAVHQHELPVHEDVLHAFRGLAPVGVGRPVADPVRVEDDEIGGQAGPDEPAVAEPSRRAGWAARCCTASSSVQVRASRT